MMGSKDIRDLVDAVAAQPPASLVLGARYTKKRGGDAGYRDGIDYQFLRLALGKDLATHFRKIVSTYAAGIADGDFVLREFDLVAPLEPREAFVIALDELQELGELLRSVLAVGNLDTYDGDNVSFGNLKMHAVILEQGEDNIAFLRSYSASKVLTESSKFAGLFAGGVFDKVTEEVLLFDEKIDAVVWRNHVIITNASAFRNMFNVARAFVDRTSTIVDDIGKKFPIANLEDLRSACVGQVQMMAKILRLPTKPHFKKLTIEDIKGNIERFNLSVAMEDSNGVESLLFEPQPDRRWLILKLLDDDYLESPMTAYDYEVGSKAAL